MNLPKGFDWIPHDLLIDKLDAYSFNRNLVLCIYSSLEKRKQIVRINSPTSSFNHMLSVIPEDSILESNYVRTLFKVALVVNVKLGFTNRFFYNLVILIKQCKMRYLN